MRDWSAVLAISLALLVPTISYGRGGQTRSIRSGGSGGGNVGNASSSSGRSVHVRNYTRGDGTQVHAYDRSAPGTASGKTSSGKSTRSVSGDTGSSSKNLADQAFGPALTPPASLVRHGSIVGTYGNSTGSATKSKATNTTNPSNVNSPANQTAAGNIQFVGGYPWLALAYSSSYLNPDTAAQRQYGALVSNARNLMRAGIYPEAAAILQRVIENAPGTRIARVAQRLLSQIPVQ